MDCGVVHRLGRGTEAVSAYFLQCGRLPDMERARQRVFELGNLLTGVASIQDDHEHQAATDRNQRQVFALIAAE